MYFKRRTIEFKSLASFRLYEGDHNSIPKRTPRYIYSKFSANQNKKLSRYKKILDSFPCFSK